jgi:pilus assembly protein CpaC
MSPRFAKTLLAATAALAVALPPAGAPAVAQVTSQPVVQPVGAAQTIDLSIGRGELITVPDTISDIFVASQGVADVQVKSTHQLYVYGVAGGETTIYASDPSGDVVWSANVRVGSNLSTVDQMLRMAMPEAQIRVATMSSNTVLLTGTIAAPEDAAEAERLVQAFMGADAVVVSRLKTATPLQVMLRVRFAEVSRSLVRTIGANLATVDGTGGFRFGVGNGRTLAEDGWSPNGPLGVGSGMGNPAVVGPDGSELPGPGIDTQNGGTTIAGLGRLFGVDLLGALDLAERQGLVTTLSEPNLTALSGETAEFLAGGEFPIPLSQGLGTTSIEYKNYGVSLAYTPTVLANGRISMRVRPEVSELSTQGAVMLEGYQIPALTIRRAETTVELGSGQSFMIAGLLSNSANSTIDKAPGAGDIPILGSLFRSNDFRRGETELVIIVTPYLVRPVDDREIRLPTDGYAAPSLAEQILMHREAGAASGGMRPMPQAAPEGGLIAEPIAPSIPQPAVSEEGQ